jgi:hypothetical protein
MNIERDTRQMKDIIQSHIDIDSVARFKGNDHIIKLDLKFDLEKMREALQEITAESGYGGIGSGFYVLPMTGRKNSSVESDNDLSGRFYTRVDDSYQEVARDQIVDESEFTELTEAFKGTYFETVHKELTARYSIGRVRILKKDIYNCNSWHRDPEPRLHIPIYTNPGSLFIVNHHCTHLPADGSVYFTDTRGYHTAFNGGETPRIHLVAALAYTEYQPRKNEQ